MPAKVRNHYNRAPRVGSKSNLIYRAMLSARGYVTGTLGENRNHLDQVIFRLRNECGYDVRSIPGKPVTGKRGCPKGVYRIVGRWHWNGKYVDFLARDITNNSETDPCPPARF